MAILVGNLASKISPHIQSRIFYVPWMKRSTTILCLKSRYYSGSSFPVRCDPRKYSQVNEIEKSLPKKGWDKSVYDKRISGVGRTSDSGEVDRSKKQTYMESVLSNETNEGFEEKIHHNVEINEEPIDNEPEVQNSMDSLKKNMQAGKTILDAEKMAIACLASRAYTAVELKKKLQAKRFSPNVVESLLTDFQSRGLINDSLYAETFSRSRWSSLSWGPRRIKQALSKKGVSEADAEKAIKLVFEDGTSTDLESKLGMSKISVDHLLVQASKQWLRGQDVPVETRKSRMIRWLQYRGFNWGVISFILKKLESPSC